MFNEHEDPIRDSATMALRKDHRSLVYAIVDYSHFCTLVLVVIAISIILIMDIRRWDELGLWFPCN